MWTKVDSSFSGISSFPQQLGEAYYTLNNSLLKPTQKGINSNIQTLVLPNEKGEMETFSIVSVPLLSDALSKRYPSIKTYEGRSVIRPEVRVRLSTHRNGINAWLKLVEGPDFFIQTQKGQKNLDTPTMIFWGIIALMLILGMWAPCNPKKNKKPMNMENL